MLGSIDTYTTPHEFIGEAYDRYFRTFGNNNAVNGKVFEFLICEALKREGVAPFYYQAKFTLVPNVDFDVVCYNPLRPVVLSAKVSLRERYKQAVLEGFILSQVYRNARSYLLTLSDEQVREQRKIQSGDVVGLTDCIRADSPDFDDLVDGLRAEYFSSAQPIIPIEGSLIA